MKLTRNELRLLALSALMLLVFLLVGCKSADPTIDKHGVSATLGGAQKTSETVTHGLEELQEWIKGGGTPLYNSVLWASRALSRTELPMAAAQVIRIQQDNQKLETRNAYLDDHFRNDKFSQWQKRKAIWIGIAIGIYYFGFGILGTVLGIVGKASPLGAASVWSGRLMRLVGFSNPFAWIRDKWTGTEKIPVSTAAVDRAQAIPAASTINISVGDQPKSKRGK